MECTRFKSRIFAFQEGSLSVEDQHSAQDHLLSCSACSRLLATFNELDEITRQLKATEPNPFAATRILQRIEDEFHGSKRQVSPAWIRVLQPVTLGIALLCGILLGSYTASKDSKTPDQVAITPENIEFLRTNLFISEFADEDKILAFNK